MCRTKHRRTHVLIGLTTYDWSVHHNMPKFLVLHPDPADLEEVLAKANAQNTKIGPFDAVILLGDVMTEPPQTSIDAPTYFSRKLTAESTHSEPSSLIKPNLICLQLPINAVLLDSGIRLTFVNATLTAAQQQQVLSTKALSATDILVTYQWPQAIADQRKLTLVGGSSFIDDVVRLAQPRYHFAVGSASGRYYESEQFLWTDAKASHGTRFISLGRKGSGDKWFYAFGIDPAATPAPSLALNPFELPLRAHTNALEEPLEPLARLPKRPLDDDQPPRKRVTPAQCFFCLSNPRCETHMIITIGTHNYITVAKGPLPNPRASRLGFTGHAIIIPIEHIASSRSGGGDFSHTPAHLELLDFAKSLVTAFGARDHAVVFFEINRLANVHHHTQVVPVPQALIGSFGQSLEDRLQNNNQRQGRNQPLEFTKYRQDAAADVARLHQLRQEADYILFTVCTGLQVEYYHCRLDETQPADLQFPRRVLASVLRCSKRVYWEKCKQTKDEETFECEAFKRFYAAHDITRK